MTEFIFSFIFSLFSLMFLTKLSFFSSQNISGARLQTCDHDHRELRCHCLHIYISVYHYEKVWCHQVLPTILPLELLRNSWYLKWHSQPSVPLPRRLKCGKIVALLIHDYMPESISCVDNGNCTSLAYIWKYVLN